MMNNNNYDTYDSLHDNSMQLARLKHCFFGNLIHLMISETKRSRYTIVLLTVLFQAIAVNTPKNSGW